VKLVVDVLRWPKEEEYIVIRALIYGCGENAKKYTENILGEGYEIVAYIDQNREGFYRGIKIDNMDSIVKYSFDEIIITMSDIYECYNVRNTLRTVYGISGDIISLLCQDTKFIEVFSDQRSEFIKDMALYISENGIGGSCAEAGVFRGDSARFINKYFSDRKLYLFDTFEGFSQEELDFEISNIKEGFNSDFFDKALFDNTSVELVTEKMIHKENLIIKKGLFPESAGDVEDKFCFVNLDMDLYLPMYNALEFFYPKMSKGGVILMHDYFHSGLQGVKKAVEDFENKQGIKLIKVPIGDHISIAVVV